jgi:nicotinamidase/pyrazinamidase
MKAITANSVLLIVDIQHDFLPEGALAVAGGDELIPLINTLQGYFNHVVATQDYHPADHGSFAALYPGKSPGERIELAGLSQILWPVHCVQGSSGADFPPLLDRSRWEAIFQKGKNPAVDSYSGFFDNARRGDTGLGDYLKERGIDRVFVCGLALDYCVKFTALDAQSLGFTTILITDATRAVNLHPQDGEAALREMKEAGIQLIDTLSLATDV